MSGSKTQALGWYRADVWQFVISELGFEYIHETNEDGGPGDLVAEVYGDNASLIVAAPVMLAALRRVVSDCQFAIDALGNSSDEFSSTREAFRIILNRAAAAIPAQVQA